MAERKGVGVFLNAEKNNATTKQQMGKKESELWLEMFWRQKHEDRNQKLFWCLSLDVRWQQAKGLGIPSDYWLLPTLESCFTTLINNLSVKHIIGQQMILFHRFLDLTDELFNDVLPLVQIEGECVEKEKTKKFQKVSYKHTHT